MPPSPNASAQLSPEPAVRVLVVEDEPLLAELVESMLLDMGYETVGPAASAQVALALYRTEPIDLVLLDIGLRGSTNGLQLAELLLAHNPVPLIFLTSFADAQTFQQAQHIGPAAYLVKPAEPESLHRAIALAVSNFSMKAWPSPPNATVAGAPKTAPATVASESLFVKENGLLEKVLLNEIYSVVADNKTCHLTLAGRSITVRMSLRELARILPGERFVQIQRSYFVNVEHIERIDPSRLLVQVGKQLLPIGRLYLTELVGRLRTIS